MTIEEMQCRAYQTAREKGWHEADIREPAPAPLGRHRGGVEIHPVQIVAWLGLVMSEAAEAIEDVRERRLTLDFDEKGKPTGLPSEMADILIRVGDVAGALGIDLQAAVEAKLAFNETRPHRHGNKTC